MKRTLFILLLALMPLGFLTVGALVDFFSVPPRQVPDDTELLQEVRQQELHFRGKIRAVPVAEEALMGLELLLPATENVATLRRLAGFHRLGVPLERWNLCSQDVSRYLELLWGFRGKEVPPLKRTLEDFQAFRKEAVEHFPENSQKVVRLLELQEEDFQERVTKAEKNAEAGNLLAEARNSFDLERYALCRDKCNTLLADYQEVLEDTVRLSVIRLKARAEVHAGTDQLGEMKLKSGSPEERLEKMQGFLASLEEVGVEHLNEEERQQFASLEKETRQLRLQITSEKAWDEIQRQVGDLGKSTPGGIPGLLETAAGICRQMDELAVSVKEDGEDSLRQAQEKEIRTQYQRIQTIVRKRILEGVPARKSSVDAHLEEVALQNGTLLQGFFRDVKEDGKIVGYKCYPSRAEWENPTVSVGTYEVSEFQGKPRLALENRLVQEYAELRKGVQEHFAERGAWVEFQNGCQKMEKQLKKYSGSSPLSFRKEIATAKVVLDEEHWRWLNKIYTTP
ncbi:MAG: hypothetical protein Q4D62_06025 [Planctomycetia bacterium]|nr:hypothetical protein [Planctomycetia bacterium]